MKEHRIYNELANVFGIVVAFVVVVLKNRFKKITFCCGWLD
jgi:hypothetical protein